MRASTVLTAEHAAELAALAAQVADYPWRAAQFVDSCAAGHQLLGLRDGAGALLGFAVWSQVLDEAELLDIGVAPTARRQGLGARLLAEVIATARAAGATRLMLEVRAGNQAAQALYQRAGFMVTGRRKGYYPAPDGREDACLMDKPLGDGHD